MESAGFESYTCCFETGDSAPQIIDYLSPVPIFLAIYHTESVGKCLKIFGKRI